MLKVTTPATNKRLTTVAAVRAQFGITTDQLNDAGVEALIDRASDAATSFCGRPFATETVRQVEFPQHLLHSITLERFPASSVGLTVSEGGASLTIDADFVLDEEVSALRRLFNGYRWDWRCLSIQIDYTAGYVLPDDDGTRNLPHDVELAVIYLAGDIWRVHQQGQLGALKREMVEGIAQIEWWQPLALGRLSNQVSELLLQPYQRIAF